MAKRRVGSARKSSSGLRAAIAPEPEALDATSQAPLFIVGIGASAGGLDAIERFFREMPSDSGMAFVVVQHLSPDYKSLMVEIISKYTRMPVLPAGDGVTVVANQVYMMQPKKNLVVVNGRLALREKDPAAVLNLPVDLFFRSLAEDQGRQSIGIVLSGTGRDGVEGVQAIKGVRGLVIAQEESTAQFDGMPKNVVATGCVDFVLAPEQMPRALMDHLRTTARPEAANAGESDDKTVGRILRLLKSRIGVDYLQYKPATILRRIHRRMLACNCRSLEAYFENLEQDSAEPAKLNQELLIGVTRFFRDTDAFAAVADKAIPDVFHSIEPGETVRVWVCGCSTGEEAYSLAMLLHEYASANRIEAEIRLFATDVDREAIDLASNGVYPCSIESDVSTERLQRFFIKRNDSYVVGRELRRSVTFAVHDAIKDPPFTKLHMISCRNLLIYLDTAAQAHCMSLFSFALLPEGFLFLGPSESIAGLASQFQSLAGRWKLYRGIPGRQRQVLSNLLPGTPMRGAPLAVLPRRGEQQAEFQYRLENRLVKRWAPPGIVVGENMNLMYTFGEATRFLRLPEGVATHEIAKLLPRGLQTVLWAGLLRAWRSGKPLRCAAPPCDGKSIEAALTLTIEPFRDTERGGNYAFVYFESITARDRKVARHTEVKIGAQEQIEDLKKSLQHAEENLQATVEELETSNEELQATNEELLSSNEELQSTNEELHSMNEELHSVNAQYQEKIQELLVLHNDMSHLFEITGAGAVFLDRDLCVRKFTPQARHFIYLMDQDVGRPIEHLSNRLYYADLIPDLRRVVAESIEIQRHVVSQDGRSVLVRLVPYTTDHREHDGCLISLSDVSSLRQAEQRLQVVVDSLAFPLAVIDDKSDILLRNNSWKLWAGRDPEHPLACSDKQLNYLRFLDLSRSLAVDDRETIKSGIQGVSVDGEAGFSHRLLARSSAHSPERDYLFTAMPVLSSPKGAVLTLLDLTASLQVSVSQTKGAAAGKN